MATVVWSINGRCALNLMGEISYLPEYLQGGLLMLLNKNEINAVYDYDLMEKIIVGILDEETESYHLLYSSFAWWKENQKVCSEGVAKNGAMVSPILLLPVCLMIMYILVRQRTLSVREWDSRL